MDLLRRAAVVIAFTLPAINADADGIYSVTTLRLPNEGTVTLELAPALTRHVRKPTDSLLFFNLKYPSGAQGTDDPAADKSSIRVVVKGVEARTRPEAAVAEASVAPAAGPADRVWLAGLQDGVRVYQLRTPSNVQELRVFKAADEVLVGTRMAAPGGSMHTADRRYKEILEIIYQYSRELDASPEQLDRFVTDYLSANIEIAQKQK